MVVEKYILLVEDDADIQECMVATLEALGHQVRVANNGKSALEVLTKHPHAKLVFLDLMMPVMSGRAFCELRKADSKLQNLPVILVSAETDLATTAKQLNANGYIAKPLSIASIERAIEKYALPEERSSRPASASLFDITPRLTACSA